MKNLTKLGLNLDINSVPELETPASVTSSEQNFNQNYHSFGKKKIQKTLTFDYS